MEQINGNSASPASSKLLVTSGDDKTRQQQQHNSKRYSVSTASPTTVVGASRGDPFSITRWTRILLKIWGPALAGEAPQNVDPKVIMLIAREVQVTCHHGIQVTRWQLWWEDGIFCGDNWVAATGTDRASTYPIGTTHNRLDNPFDGQQEVTFMCFVHMPLQYLYHYIHSCSRSNGPMKMMASVMNSILLQASQETIGMEARVQTALTMQEVAKPYIRCRAIRHLEKGRVVIFCGIGAGIGNPLFTTDTAAALRASEINADVVLKGIVSDDEYGCSPRTNSNTPFEHISFRELALRGFSRIDLTTITCCEENNIPVVIFNMLEPGNISRAICGDQIGTLVDQSGRIS